MPFGKNKKLTMPGAQKTKVPAREDAWEIENETGITGAEEPAPQGGGAPPTDAPADPSPGRAKRKLAKDECDELGIA